MDVNDPIAWFWDAGMYFYSLLALFVIVSRVATLRARTDAEAQVA
jgi:hypothetical protein